MAEEENKSAGISGLILDTPQSSVVGDLVEEVIVVIRLKDQNQVYAFDVTDNEDLVIHVLNEVEEEVPN